MVSLCSRLLQFGSGSELHWNPWQGANTIQIRIRIVSTPSQCRPPKQKPRCARALPHRLSIYIYIYIYIYLYCICAAHRPFLLVQPRAPAAMCSAIPRGALAQPQMRRTALSFSCAASSTRHPISSARGLACSNVPSQGPNMQGSFL